MRLVVLVFLLLLFVSTHPSVAQSDDAGLRYYTATTLRVTDEAAYAAYRHAAAPLLAEYGCVVEREILLNGPPQGTLDIGTPTRLIISYCTTRTALHRLGNDPRYAELKPQHEAATAEVQRFAGVNVFFGSASDSPVAERLYIAKLTRYKPLDFEPELNRINGTLAPFGYQRERLLLLHDAPLDAPLDAPVTLGVSFYERAEQQAELLRNQELMGAVTTFNQTYTDGFVYLVGTAH